MNPSFITSPVSKQDSEQLFSSKLLSRTTPMKIKLGTKILGQGIVHTMDMVLNNKELFLKLAVKLAVPKK